MMMYGNDVRSVGQITLMYVHICRRSVVDLVPIFSNPNMRDNMQHKTAITCD